MRTIVRLHVKKCDNNYPIIEGKDYYYSFYANFLNDNKLFQIVNDKKMEVGKHDADCKVLRKDYNQYEVEFKIYFHKLEAPDRIIIPLNIDTASGELVFNGKVVGVITDKIINVSNIDILLNENEVLEPVKDAIKGLVLSQF